MHDLTAKRETTRPKFEHALEVFETVSDRERLSFRFAEFDSINRNERIAIALMAARVDLDLLDLDAWDTHQEPRFLGS
jgi:hypothetical protein